MILIIKNISVEGPETLGLFLEARGFDLKIVELYKGESLPDDVALFEAVICLGGPMNVYEEERYPFLLDETFFVQQCIKKEIPFLGLCLGAQLLANAAGAQVVKASVKEIGFSTVTISSDGELDPLFQGCVKTFPVFQWHEDTFSLPQDSTLLASSELCKHQAFRVGKNAYGLQFHVEITENSIKNWNQAYIKDEVACLKQISVMQDDYARVEGLFNQSSKIMYQNFVNLIQTQHIRRKICV